MGPTDRVSCCIDRQIECRLRVTVGFCGCALLLSLVLGSACLSISHSHEIFNGDRAVDPDATAKGWTARIRWMWAHQGILQQGSESINRAVMPECVGAVVLRAHLIWAFMPVGRTELKKACQCRRVSAHPTRGSGPHVG